MTSVTTTCPGCGRTLAVPARYHGRDLKCPECGHPLRVDPPAPDATPTAPVLAEATSPATEEFVGEPFAAAEPVPDAGLPVAAVYWRARRFGVLSVAAAGAVVYGALGAVVGIGLAVAAILGRRLPLPFAGVAAALVALVAAPLAYAVLGFVAGAAVAALYNLAARFTGGVSVLLE